ncbi:MAG: methyltransferase, partial [Bacilli bacterium]
MAHYFDNDPSVASKMRKIDFEIYDKHLTFYSDNGVFSKNSIDEGTRAFLKVLIPLQLQGKILDLGCGYGVIGLTLASFNPNLFVTLA